MKGLVWAVGPGHSTKELPLLWIAVQNGHGLVLRFTVGLLDGLLGVAGIVKQIVSYCGSFPKICSTFSS